MTAKLTRREQAVMRLRATGKTMAAVGLDLGISEQTVKHTCASVYRKLDVAGFVEAMNALGWVRVVGGPNDRVRWADHDDAAAERRFLQPLNPDPVTAIAKAVKR